MKEELLQEVISEITKGDWGVLILEIKGSPFELEEELKKRVGEKISHFWSPGSKIGVIIVEGKKCRKIFWVLGNEDKIIKKEREGESSEAIEGISSSLISDPFLVAFKGRF